MSYDSPYENHHIVVPIVLTSCFSHFDAYSHLSSGKLSSGNFFGRIFSIFIDQKPTYILFAPLNERIIHSLREQSTLVLMSCDFMFASLSPPLIDSHRTVDPIIPSSRSFKPSSLRL